MASIYEFYSDQVVFMTGATGGLGGCLLYKLGIVLRVQRLYVLVRGSETRALERWQNTMPHQFNEINEQVQAGNIVLVVGDITMANLGISEGIFAELQR